ncbi:MAG TPA: arginine--tRNA ligase [Candidatus Baltobacteraceae bacterium]|nr:arginine--tRNA ligase [Candidatus Baltobacteraceae bacterium]
MNPTTTEPAGAPAPQSDRTPLTLEALAERFAAAARELWPDAQPVVQFEPARRAEFGEISSNVALPLAKVARAKPQDLAAALIERALADDAVRATVARAEPTAGFVNLTLVPAFWQRVVADVLRRGEDYGRAARAGERISLEFGSANPTGPLAVVQGRALSAGDTLAKILRHAGYDVFTEWIINDAGNQIALFGLSVYARYRQLFDPSYPFPEDGYAGDYVVDIAKKLRERDGEKWLDVPADEAAPQIGRFARDVVVAEQQDVARRFGVTYDLWQSEKALHDAGAIERGVQRLRDLGVLYERDGATWLRTRDAGDDEDRVVIRSDGRPTYYANDVAYHYDKLQRADHVIDILGPDHHGYIARLNALAQAYGRPKAIEVLIAQQITLKRGGETVSMSKRAGTLITLQDVIDEVGVDAARFFFVMLSLEQPLTFDLDLAKKQSNENPVYYVQYGHARIASVLRRAAEQAPEALAAAPAGATLTRLVEPAEIALVRRLAEFPAAVAGAARARAPHRVPKYARDLASDFHQFYDTCRVLTDDRELTAARLSLCIATKTVLASALHLCGVGAPDSM